MQQHVSPMTFREALRGNIPLDRLPVAFASQIRAMWERMARVEAQQQKRADRAAKFARVGLNGKRAVARRLRQMGAGA